MPKDKKQKMYALTVTVKPKPAGIVRYSSKTFRGFAAAYSPDEAKQLAIEQFCDSFNDGKPPVISGDDIIIKDCKCHNDFFTKTKE